MMGQLKIACSLLILFTITEYSTALFNNENICNKDGCYSCIGYACTKFCTGPGCSNCLNNNIQCCQDDSCNLCFGQRCCTNITCNQCVGSCVQDCLDDPTCYSTCFNKCSPDPIQDTPRIIHNLNRNYPFNVTTTINITNTINNTNYIDSAINANTTGYNNFTLKLNNSTTKDNPTSGQSFKCCNVTHPASCDLYSGYRICQIKKHVECSAICRANHILIGPGNGTQATISVMVPPYRYIGNFQTIDCDRCYSCGYSESPKECSKSSYCPKSCQQHISLENNRNQQRYVYNTQNQPIVNEPIQYGRSRDPVTHLATKSLESPHRGNSIPQTTKQNPILQYGAPIMQYIPQTLPLQFLPQTQYTHQNWPIQYLPGNYQNVYPGVNQNENQNTQGQDIYVQYSPESDLNVYPALNTYLQSLPGAHSNLYPTQNENYLHSNGRRERIPQDNVYAPNYAQYQSGSKTEEQQIPEGYFYPQNSVKYSDDANRDEHQKPPRKFNVVQEQQENFPAYNVIPVN